MKKLFSMVTVLALLCVMFTTSALARQEVRTVLRIWAMVSP